jgi:hypothetical protein
MGVQELLDEVARGIALGSVEGQGRERRLLLLVEAVVGPRQDRGLDRRACLA